ncbi:hypothetical protein B2J88_27110 [Rhodococcus sp. SRB_17]|nr:hypothetical protein [Rhodococcus sp. SRB_17]
MEHQATPSPKVTAAVTYLLNQPDAAEFRKKHQVLIDPASTPGRHSDDFTSADTFAINSARHRARELGESDPTALPALNNSHNEDVQSPTGRHRLK